MKYNNEHETKNNCIVFKINIGKLKRIINNSFIYTYYTYYSFN